jgi:hypothetical protein
VHVVVHVCPYVCMLDEVSNAVLFCNPLHKQTFASAQFPCSPVTQIKETVARGRDELKMLEIIIELYFKC